MAEEGFARLEALDREAQRWVRNVLPLAADALDVEASFGLAVEGSFRGHATTVTYDDGLREHSDSLSDRPQTWYTRVPPSLSYSVRYSSTALKDLSFRWWLDWVSPVDLEMTTGQRALKRALLFWWTYLTVDSPDWDTRVAVRTQRKSKARLYLAEPVACARVTALASKGPFVALSSDL